MLGSAACLSTSASWRWRWQPPPPCHHVQPRCRRRRHCVNCSKALDYQDCQDYARPLRLLPITEANVCTQSSLEEMFTSSGVAESGSLYIVKLQTSTAYGSCLSDLNAGILLCIIDENGNSELLRMPATPMMYPPVKGTAMQDHLCFQRGSVDEFTFEGPKLGQIRALWLGLESGCWRFGGVSLIVINGSRDSFDQTGEDGKKVNSNSGFRYEFEAEDITFGGSGDVSMVELRPSHVTELSGGELLASLDFGSQSNSVLDVEISNKESMREYADLKSSLLIYDSVLVLAGMLIASISSGEKAGLAFLIGGAGGFLYLLLLQKSVDKLPAPALISMRQEEEKRSEVFGIWSWALVFVFAGVALKYGAGSFELTAREMLVGMAGFLSCKIAVVLAAFNPMPIKLKKKR